jgi:integrase
LSVTEVQAVLAQLNGTRWLMASLLYGVGLRLMECLRLRVKDVDFAYQQLIVHNGKGEQDRVTMLPKAVQESLKRHLATVDLLHQGDVAEGYGSARRPCPHRDPSASNRPAEGRNSSPVYCLNLVGATGRPPRH